MSLLQSAFDFLSGSATRDDNDFVGHTVELGDLRLGVKRVIAEGESAALQASVWARIPVGEGDGYFARPHNYSRLKSVALRLDLLLFFWFR